MSHIDHLLNGVRKAVDGVNGDWCGALGVVWSGGTWSCRLDQATTRQFATHSGLTGARIVGGDPGHHLILCHVLLQEIIKRRKLAKGIMSISRCAL